MIRKERSDDCVDAERRARASTVQSRLARREFTSASGAKPEQIFRSIPPRLTIPVERVIDDARKMLSCVLLGFTADGDHLVSYSAEGGENFSFELQIWKFQPGARARLLARSGSIALYVATLSAMSSTPSLRWFRDGRNLSGWKSPSISGHRM